MSKNIMDRLTTKWAENQADGLAKQAEIREKQMQIFVAWLLDHLKWEPEKMEFKDDHLMAEGDGLKVSAHFNRPSRIEGINVWLPCPSCAEVLPSYRMAVDLRTLAQILFTIPFVPNDGHNLNDCPGPAIPPVEGS